MDRKHEVMGWLEGLAQNDWRDWHSDSEVQNIAEAALKLIKIPDICENCAMAIEDRQMVVRCKYCRHGVRLEDSDYYVCSKPFASNRETHTADWFCADGEAK